jgi:tripartite ATP-independent transporter DctM subunit
VGRLNGGLGHTNIVTGTLFGSMSGAAVAEAVSMGRIFIPAMEKAGYSRPYAAALTAASSLQSPLIPPSIIAVVYGAVMGVSIGGLLIGGFVPGVLMGAMCMVLNAYFCHGKHLRTERTGGLKRGWGKVLISSVPALFVPVIILGGIVFGLFTPTEAAAVAVVYAALFGFIVRRNLHVSDLWPLFSSTARTSSQVLLIIGTASLLSWLSAVMQLPSMTANLLLSISHNRNILLLLINALLLVIGMFFEPGSAIILFGPILAPVASAVHLDPIHFGIIMLVNLTIGMVTPPVGTVLYATSAISGVSVAQLSLYLCPFILGGVVVCLVISYSPGLALFLPRLLGF